MDESRQIVTYLNSNSISHDEQIISSQSKKHASLFPYFICVLITIPQLVTQTYSAYFKLDGFNDSLKDLNSLGRVQFPTMCGWVIGVLVAVYLLQYISYAIIPTFGNVGKNATQSKEGDGENTKGNSTIDTICNHVAWKNFRELNKTDLVIFSVILLNTAVYGYVSFNAANETFFKQAWCHNHDLAIGLAIICTIGILFKESGYSMPRAISTFPHLLKLKSLYWNIKIKPNKNIHFERFQRILCGVLLVMLAISSVPVTLIVASHSPLNYWLAVASAILAMIVVYAVSVYGLCGKEIDAMNRRKLGNEKTNADEEKWSFGRYLGFGFCSILFLIGCLISAVGTGFSWQKTFSDKTSLSYEYILAIFFGMTLLALIGRMQFCNKKKTINGMVDSPHKVKQGVQFLWHSNDEPSTSMGQLLDDQIEGQSVKNKLNSFALSSP